MILKYIWLWMMGMCLSIGIAVRAETGEAAGTAAATSLAEAAAEADTLLTTAPQLHLKDPLSATLYDFVLQSGSYTWNVLEHGETKTVVACGTHPLDPVMDREDRLQIPNYNRLDAVPFLVTSTVLFDRLTVTMWDSSQIGVTGAEGESRAYEGENLIGLESGKVYEIAAEWSDERLPERGFSGTALYVVITE